MKGKEVFGPRWADSNRINIKAPDEIVEYSSEDGKWKKYLKVQGNPRWAWLNDVKHNPNAKIADTSTTFWKVGILVFLAAAVARIIIFGV